MYYALINLLFGVQCFLYDEVNYLKLPFILRPLSRLIFVHTYNMDHISLLQSVALGIQETIHVVKLIKKSTVRPKLPLTLSLTRVVGAK